ncbi:alpha-glucuronidase [Mucilaginibacter sp. PPCGB 2223]|uniref:alpha-glucuronidase family glycosyl hydrolase n=1 Tax=Mucilaginibacter sp. PPCGB 2223 TaxID=1886027 RepID=UPI00082674CA|nr:alpha-glucuronidase family glycosyl hydrolase [Mucilaginibacter sp. PPCGB 2223]OCX54845.1 alpha-glucuronidase [Mucilaginibacter sp. PPCGB 2223]
MRVKIRLILLILAGILLVGDMARAENGYELWLRYAPVTDVALKAQYQKSVKNIYFPAGSDRLKVAHDELYRGLSSMIGLSPAQKTISESELVIATIDKIGNLRKYVPDSIPAKIGTDGFLIKTITTSKKNTILLTANSDLGILYGVFNFLKLFQINSSLAALNIAEYPKTMFRVLDHWDNPTRTVERGYAGFSIWNWHKLPGYIDPRYIDYARANASVGINGSVINNVNANTIMLTPAYLAKIKALADVFRLYGIKIYLSVKFSSPVELGGLKTADPLDEDVKAWWKAKVDEIYRYIPDFGGFLVKANSEGQPGPQTYGRTHADGANMLGKALAPHHGIVMWRAFVYDDKVPDDRAKQAYNEFKPFDGKFDANVIIQVKNGAIDFQPREPFHPLFGALPNTSVMLELQLTQEYLGFSTHLVYEAPLFKECLNADTYTAGPNSTVEHILEGRYNPKLITGMAGVANIGTDINWCGHPFAQANWYSFGRLAWNPGLSATKIADDWLRMTFTNDHHFIEPMKREMLQSRENTVNYMTPLGLHHIMGANGHYGPGPWTDNTGRADWTAVYYHKADTNGVGFDRTRTGSNALAQYSPQVQKYFEDLSTCPDEYLLWFHHLSWNYRMRSGKTLWDEMVEHYYRGADSVKHMQLVWNLMEKYIDHDRFTQVKELMAIQHDEAIWWRDACVLYFQTFSRKPIPDNFEKPLHNLAYYRSLRIPNIPGQGIN